MCIEEWIISNPPLLLITSARPLKGRPVSSKVEHMAGLTIGLLVRIQHRAFEAILLW